MNQSTTRPFLNPVPPRKRRVHGRYNWLGVILWVLVCAALDALANTQGSFYFTWILGLLAGLLIPGRTILPATVAGALAWGIPLSLTPLVTRSAAVVASVMGLGGQAPLLLVVTVLWGAVLSACGAWIGSSIRQLWLVSRK